MMTETQRHHGKYGFIRDRLHCGWYHVAGLLDDGTVKAYGGNNANQCEVSDWTDIVKIKCGSFHTLGLKKDGTALATKGEVFKDDKRIPGEGIEKFSDVVDIACGSFHNIGLRSDGTVVACGFNNEGQCNVENWKNIRNIYAALYHTIAICNDGSLVYCGKNDGGSLNLGNISGVKKLYCGVNDTVIVTEDDKVYITDYDHETPICIDIIGNEIMRVEFHVNYFLILKTNGTVMHFGSEDHGLAEVSQWRGILDIVCARKVASGYTKDRIYMTGDNGIRTMEPMKDVVLNLHSETIDAFVKKNGTVIVFNQKSGDVIGTFKLYETLPYRAESQQNHLYKSGIAWEYKKKYDYLKQRVSCGLGHGAAVMYDGTVRACGSNTFGQCDVDDWVNIKSVICTTGATFGLSYDGIVYFTGQLPLSDSYVAEGLHPSKWPDNVKLIVKADSTEEHVLGLLDNGQVVAYGCNDDGQCEVGDWQDIVEVCAQRALSAGVRKDGTVVVCGNDTEIKTIVSTWTDVKHIFNGSSVQSLIGLKNDGTVVTTESEMASKLSIWSNIIDISAERPCVAGITGDGHIYFAGKKVSKDMEAEGVDDALSVHVGGTPLDVISIIKNDKTLRRFIIQNGEIETEDLNAEILFVKDEFMQKIHVWADGGVLVTAMLEDIDRGQDDWGDDWQLIKPETPKSVQNSSDSNETSGTTKSSSGCYVATCVYGSYDCPQVWTLRRYRDNTLGSTWYGRSFIRTYYAISPALVKLFGNTSWFKKLWKGKLDRMVAKLNADGVEDTPYQDRIW